MVVHHHIVVVHAYIAAYIATYVPSAALLLPPYGVVEDGIGGVQHSTLHSRE